MMIDRRLVARLQAMKPGDKVFIQKNADYEMEVDGERLYRVMLSHIYAQVQE